jgi:hypothetical protein
MERNATFEINVASSIGFVPITNACGSQDELPIQLLGYSGMLLPLHPPENKMTKWVGRFNVQSTQGLARRSVFRENRLGHRHHPRSRRGHKSTCW